jgi:NAD(P)-dependent dehydrogenase (short-subunit alcohol dehydrogenase family)
MGILAGKTAIVTGGGRGIGRAHCLELAKQGAKVVVNDLGSSVHGEGAASGAADATVALIRTRGGEAVANYGDVGDYAQAGALIEQACEVFGGLDILVNNAGIVRDGAIWNMTEADFDSVIRVHLKGAWTTAHHAARYWRRVSKAGGKVAGRIINTTSGAGLSGNFGQTNYASAKAAIAGLTLTLSLELQRLGVTVNCVSPGAMTRITATIPGYPPPLETDQIPEGEWTAKDPACSSPVVAWLASDDAHYVTGQVLHVIGDRIAWLQGWTPIKAITAGQKHWKAESLATVMGTRIFGTRAAGIVVPSEGLS